MSSPTRSFIPPFVFTVITVITVIRIIFYLISQHHPEIEVVVLQMMPDHFHGILFVKEQMEKPLGMALRGLSRAATAIIGRWYLVFRLLRWQVELDEAAEAIVRIPCNLASYNFA